MRYDEIDEQIPLTAIHEAGHIAAAWFAGIPVMHVGLVPISNELGHVWTVPKVVYRSHSEHLADVVSSHQLSSMAVTLGGIVAETVFDLADPAGRFEGYGSDVYRLQLCAEAVAGSDADALIARLTLSLEFIFRIPHVTHGIQYIADELLYYRALDEFALHEILPARLHGHWVPKRFAFPKHLAIIDDRHLRLIAGRRPTGSTYA